MLNEPKIQNTKSNSDLPSLVPESGSLSDLTAPCLRYEVGEVTMNDHKFVALFSNDQLVEVHVENQQSGCDTETIFKWTKDYELGDMVH